MKKVIVTSFDENYMDYSMVMAKTLGSNYTGNDALDLVCLVPENLLSSVDYYKESIQQNNVNVIFKSAPELLEKVSNVNVGTLATPYVTPHAYQRIFIGSMLPEYDIAIYIDPDTIILRDVSPLIGYKSSSDFLAVLETVNSGRAVFDDDDFPYFNSGVFVANLNFWRSENIEQKIIDWIAKNPNSIYAEQDSLNAILVEHLSPLPFHFNFFEWIIDNNRLMAREYDNPLIVHFVGPDKPWGSRAMSKYGELWRQVYSGLGKSL